ncbi:MAG: chorismate lyase [Gammaproteobacteria bacterium]|nr:chorismate lyase [Gammaproteobacteria bacterium]
MSVEPLNHPLGLRWHTPRQARLRWRNDIDADVWERLLDRGSLTARVKEQAQQAFKVELLAQHNGRPSPEEAQMLKMHRAAGAIVREVKLYADNAPLVFAHTVIPLASVHGKYRHLLQLGTKPLGAALFGDPTIVRGPVELTCLHPGDLLWDNAVTGIAAPEYIWGRRSAFYLAKKPILVSEFFLPGWR